MSLHSVEFDLGEGFLYLLEAEINPNWRSVEVLRLYVVGESKVDPNTGLTVENKVDITSVLTRSQWNEFAEMAINDWDDQCGAKVDDPDDWDYSNAGGDR